MTHEKLYPHILPIVASAALLTVGAGCSTSHAKTQPAAEKPAIRVEGVDVVLRAVPHTRVLTGTLVADRESEVMADTAGKVVETFGNLGEPVKAGTPLVRLDARAARLSETEARAEVARLEAQKENSDRECVRAEALFSNGAISRSAYESMTTNCTTADQAAHAARARQALANKSVSDSVLRAPFDGVIAERSVELGEYVTPGRRIATVVDSRELRLELSIPESAMAAVSEGSRVEFMVAAHPGARFSAVVDRTGPIIRRASRDQAVEAVVDNGDGRLSPGMFATAHIAVGRSELPVVPESSLFGAEASRRVFVIQSKELEERIVHVGAVRDGIAPILKGLVPGEKVVVSPSEGLSDGTRLQ